MKRSILAAAGAGILLLAAAGAWVAGSSRQSSSESEPAPESIVPPAVQDAPASEGLLPESQNGSSDSEEDGEVLCRLEGDDFVVTCSGNPDESSMRLSVSLKTGSPLDFWLWEDGSYEKPESLIWSTALKVKLEKVLSHELRPQLVVTGDQMLTRGEGTIGSYTLYRVSDEGVFEAADFILSRVREAEGEEVGADRLKGIDFHANLEWLDGNTRVRYKYRLGAGPEQEIVFAWNGQRYEDESGRYEELVSSLR